MAADTATRMFGLQVLWAQLLLLQRPQSTGSSKAAQVAPRDGSAPPPYGATPPFCSPRPASPAVQHPSPARPCDCNALWPTRTASLQPGSALSLQKQMEHASQQTGFSDSSSLCSLGYSPQNASLPPATCADATSRKVMLCSYKPTWPWAPPRLAQPDPWLYHN